MKRTLISKTGQKIRLMSIKGKTFVTLGKKTMPLHLSLDEAEYKAYLDKNKKVVDYEDYIEIDFTNAKITKIFCEECKKSGNLEGIAEWVEE